MSDKELLLVQFIFEDETLEVDARDIFTIDLKNISFNKVKFALSNTVNDKNIVGETTIRLKPTANGHYESLTNKLVKTKFERLLQCDITNIRLVYTDMTYDEYEVPWKTDDEGYKNFLQITYIDANSLLPTYKNSLFIYIK